MATAKAVWQSMADAARQPAIRSRRLAAAAISLGLLAALLAGCTHETGERAPLPPGKWESPAATGPQATAWRIARAERALRRARPGRTGPQRSRTGGARSVHERRGDVARPEMSSRDCSHRLTYFDAIDRFTL